MPLIKNNNPIKKTGKEITNRLIGSLYVLKNIVNNTERIIKAIPPIFSFFHERISKAIRIKTGIECIKNPITICKEKADPLKISKENKLKNKINAIDKALGSQYNIFFIYHYFTTK